MMRLSAYILVLFMCFGCRGGRSVVERSSSVAVSGVSVVGSSSVLELVNVHERKALQVVSIMERDTLGNLVEVRREVVTYDERVSDTIFSDAKTEAVAAFDCKREETHVEVEKTRHNGPFRVFLVWFCVLLVFCLVLLYICVRYKKRVL